MSYFYAEDAPMAWVDLQRVAVAQQVEQGHRVGYMLFGAGENSAELCVRVATVRARAVAAVGEPEQMVLL